MDAIFLLKQPVTVKTEDKGFNKERARAAGGDAVLIHAIGKPAFVAKNRYGIPATVRFDRGQGFAAISSYLPGAAVVVEQPKPATKKKAA
jgi:hypothetical protein